ncbi:MAG: hypothetical protein LBT83_02210 [Tannerella sp.]|nr:hypothetical protein [Tannerella sp.]
MKAVISEKSKVATPLPFSVKIEIEDLDLFFVIICFHRFLIFVLMFYLLAHVIAGSTTVIAAKATPP